MVPEVRIPKEIGLLFEADGSRPEISPAHGGEMPTTDCLPPVAAGRFRRYETLFGDSRDTGTVVLLRYPDRMIRFRLPGWLAKTLPGPDENGLDWYRRVRGSVPAAAALLYGLPVKQTAAMVIDWFRRGLLTGDMLLGLIRDPDLPGEALYREFSPRMQRDLDGLLACRGSGGKRWTAVAGAALRINVLHDPERIGRSHPELRLLLDAAAAAASRALCEETPFAGQLSRMTGEAGAAEVRERLPRRLLAAASREDAEAVAAIPGLFSARGREQFLEDAASVGGQAGTPVVDIARFRIFRILASAAARRRPYLEQDIVSFLNRRRGLDDRRFLTVESGLTLLGSALPVMGKRSREALLTPMDAGIALLLEDLASGRVSLSGPIRGKDAVWALAEQWQSLELMGF